MYGVLEIFNVVVDNKNELEFISIAPAAVTLI